MILEEPGITADALNLHITQVAAQALNIAPLCRTRICRRTHHCLGAPVTGNWPPCIASVLLHGAPVVDQLLEVMLDIRERVRPAQPSGDPDIDALESMAILILHQCLPLMPRFAPHFHDWLRRREEPPSQPGDVLAKCRAEMKAMGIG